MLRLLVVPAMAIMVMAAPVMASESIPSTEEKPSTERAAPQLPPEGQMGGHGSMFSQADTNSDGSLTKDEFVAAAQKRAASKFDILDKNHDGKLTKDEMPHPRMGMGGHMMRDGESAPPPPPPEDKY